MKNEPHDARPSRRRWLRTAGGAGLIAAAAVTAETIAKPPAAQAGTDGDVVLGAGNDSTSTTYINCTAAEQDGFQAYAVAGGLSTTSAIYGQCGDGYGVAGYTQYGTGVYGQASGTGGGVVGYSTGGVGVYGSGGPGVQAVSGSGTALQATSDSGWGVQAQSASNTALQAGSDSGTAVVGTSTSAAGVYGQSGTTDGFALTRDGVRGFTDSPSAAGVRGENSNSGPGVSGYSAKGWGVQAQSASNTALQAGSGTGTGVVGTSTSAAGVYGQSGATDGFALTRDGVRGFTDSATAAGVRGENSSGGHGLSGVTTSTGAGGSAAVDGTNNGTGPGVRGIGGIGVLAEAAGSGTALQVQGRAVFSRAGEVSITYPASSAAVTVPGGLAGHPLVLALLQTATPGVFVTSAVPDTTAGKVTIRLNRPPGTASHPATAKVAWFILN